MGRKPKFKPVITRVKLNPEQAVLSCNCYSSGARLVGGGMWGLIVNHSCYGIRVSAGLGGCLPVGAELVYPGWTPATASS
ncbi:MAG: hypothetical protein V1670_05615 [Candidatus Omnitrophota bacterium]